MYDGVVRIDLHETRRFGRQVCDILQKSGVYDRHGMHVQPHDSAPDTRVRLFRHGPETDWSSHSNRPGALTAAQPYKLLLHLVRDMATRETDGMVLVYYASLRKIVEDWLKHAGHDRVPVRTIRQSKGRQK